MPDLHSIDTSSLVKLKQYPRDVFRSLWTSLEALIKAGRLISPREVLREPSVGDDEIEKWAKKQKRMFVDLEPVQERHLRTILTRFPRVEAEHIRLGPYADPIVVALAMARTTSATKCHVVTEERLRGEGAIKIPNLCQEFSVPVLTLLEMFRLERFVF